MTAVTYTATEGLDLQATELGAWLAETTAGSATGAGASVDLSSTGTDLDATGTLTKAAVVTGAGLMQFTGWSAANYLTRAYGADLDITGAITVLAWIKPANLTGSQAVCGNRRTGSGDYGGYGINVEAGKLRFSVTDNAGASVHAADASNVSTSAWTLAVGTMDASGNVKIYKNGSLMATTASGTIGATAAVLAVGVENVSGTLGNAFSGGISLVRVIDAALTAADILEIYNNEKTLFKANAPYRQVGIEYSLDLKATAITRSESPDRNAVRSLGGNQETIFIRRDTGYSCSFTDITTADLPTMRNFIHSIEGGETFTFDPYGSVASPDDPFNVIAEPGYTESRQGFSDYFVFSLNLREV